MEDLGTVSLSWWDLKCIIKHLPRDSAMSRVKFPDAWMWDLKAQIMAGQFDLLAGGNWQRAGNRHAKKPEPLPRPGVEGSTTVKKHKPKQAATIADIRRRLKLDERQPLPDRDSQIRAAVGSQRAIAERFGVSQSTVSRIKRGGFGVPRP